LISYKPKNAKVVLILSSFHRNKSIADEEEKKLNVIHYYNKTKTGVDSLDQLIGTYTSKRKVNRWPIALFSNMLDVTTYNVYVIHSEIYTSYNAKLKYKRRIFLAELGESLVSEEIIRRKKVLQCREVAKLSKSLLF